MYSKKQPAQAPFRIIINPLLIIIFYAEKFYVAPVLKKVIRQNVIPIIHYYGLIYDIRKVFNF